MSSLEAKQSAKQLSKAVSPYINPAQKPYKFRAPWPRWYSPPVMPKGALKQTNASDLIKAVCARTGILTSEFRSKDRRTSFVRCRHAVVYVLHRYRPDMSYPQIARACGLKCHSSVMNGIERAILLKRVDPEFASLITHLEGIANGS